MLLVDDDQPEVLEIDAGTEQPMGADENVDLAFGQAFADVLDFPGTTQPGDHFDVDRPVGEAVLKGVEVLLRQQGGGREHGHLPAALHRHERRPHGDLGLAEPHVAADQPVGGLLRTDVRQHRIDGLGLVGGEVEGKLAGKTLVLRRLRAQRRRCAGGPPGG